MNEQSRFQQAEAIFERACALEGAERESYLRDACADDGALRRAVDALLAADTGSIAEALEQAPEVIPDPEALRQQMRTPETVGPYRVVGVLGRGGMGVVYRANQQSPERQVALKVLRPGLLSKSLLRRFELEASVLARLKHPGIATVYEAGTADTGDGVQPYFAMELVAGRPLTEYAQVHDLSTRARLDLLAKVCDAVQHAHQRGVIHRDLKPGNILVTDDGQPKVLDFGVARSVNSDLRVTTQQTDIGQLVGTAPYMSPEQIEGRPDELDTRSDVYALGVLGYELLAGRLPYDLEKRALYEVVRVIREEEPTSLSAINRTLRGDVETMIAKALEKERDRRYQSASDLAADLRRYLSDEPIQARRASSWYQLRKFAKRNRALVGGVAAVFVVLVAGLIGVGVALARALDAEAEVRGLLGQVQSAREAEQIQLETAQREQQRAGEINQAFKDAILSVTPGVAAGQDTTLMRRVLSEASDRFETQLDDQPLTRAELAYTLGTAYRQISVYDEAEAQFKLADEFYRLGGNEPASWKAHNAVATVLGQLQRFEEAEPMHREAIEQMSELLGAESGSVLSARSNLASTLHAMARLHEALAIWQDLASIHERLSGPESEDAYTYRRLAAGCLMDMGDYAAAAPEIEFHAQRAQDTLDPDDPERIRAEYTLAVVLAETGRNAEARPVIERCVEASLRIFGDEHFETARAINQLGLILGNLGEHEGAAEAFERSLEMNRKLFGEDHQNTLSSLSNLVGVYVDNDEYEKAEPLIFKVLESRERTLPPNHPGVANSLNMIGTFYRHQDRFAEAAPYYTRGYEICRAGLPPGHFAIGITQGGLGICLAFMGHFEDAQRELLASHELIKAGMGEHHPMTHTSIRNLIDLYQLWDKPDDAAIWIEELPEEHREKQIEDAWDPIEDAGAYTPPEP